MWKCLFCKSGLALVFLMSAGVAHVFPQPRPPAPQYRVETPLVTVPVVVMDKKGNLYTGLERENFQVLEDGKPQPITTFLGGEAPLTIVLLLEYSRVVQYIRGEVLRPAGMFVSQILGRDDYAAIVSFDIRPHLLSDFTKNRQKLLDAIQSLLMSPPGFSDSALFDALKFVVAGGTLEEIDYKGLAEVDGRTAVLLIATGINSFSRITFDEARRAVANSGVPVYSVGVGELAYIRAEPYLSDLQRLTFLQAQNQLRTFSQESGGRFYSPRFQGAVGGILDSIAKMLRYQYTLGYVPPGSPSKGKKREIEVLVDVDGDGRPDNDRLEIQHRRYYYEPEQ